MNTDSDPGGGPVRLPGFAGQDPADAGTPFPPPAESAQFERATRARTDGVRRVRRMSNWTAAALIAGTGAATVALAHNAFPVSAPATSAASTTGSGTTSATSGGPQLSHSVATSSGSSVIVTTTTHTASGKVIVTHVRHVKPYHDN